MNVSEIPILSQKTVHIQTKQAMVELSDAVPESWLKAYPRGIMIEYSSRCNLRCKYCTKANPGDDQIPGRDMDMQELTVDTVCRFLRENRFAEVLLAGTGESTFHPRWTKDFPRLIEAAKLGNPTSYVHLNSNFAVKYQEEHLNILALLDGIVISIDTDDPQLTREVRAKSDLGLIVLNLLRFKTHCESNGLRFPRITINVTLYERAVGRLKELLIMLSHLPVSHVTISDMFETDSARENHLRHVNADNLEGFVAAVKTIQDAIEYCQASGRFSVTLQQQLVDRINRLISDIKGQQASSASNDSTPNQVLQDRTKHCLQPWTRFTVGADGALFPCCVTDMTPMGMLDAQPHFGDSGLDSERMRRFRHALLVGNVPSICLNCTNAPTTSIQELQRDVNLLAKAFGS